jgi:hypothetical protein
VIESLEPHEIDLMLLEQHVRGISEETQRILAARVCGWSVTAIASRLHYGESSVHRDIEKLQDMILGPLGLKHDGWATSRWFSHHTACCMAFAAELIEKGRVFPREKGLSGSISPPKDSRQPTSRRHHDIA